jgi:hypothetical protein
MKIVEGETMRLLNKYVYPKILVTKVKDNVFIGTKLELKNSDSLKHTFIIKEGQVIKGDKHEGLDTVTKLMEEFNKDLDNWIKVDLVSSKSFVVKESDVVSLFADIVGKDNMESYTRYLRFKSRDNIL